MKIEKDFDSTLEEKSINSLAEKFEFKQIPTEILNRIENLSKRFIGINEKNKELQARQSEKEEVITNLQNLLDESAMSNAGDAKDEKTEIQILKNKVEELNAISLNFNKFKTIYSSFENARNEYIHKNAGEKSDLAKLCKKRTILDALELLIKNLGELTQKPIEYTK